MGKSEDAGTRDLPVIPASESGGRDRWLNLHSLGVAERHCLEKK